ncbi:MAG: sugar phosphate isomerase/epimerase [Mesorhizobium sp.]|nr:MAG: sugar phosphate isomerase/epimerase [Mesorhizobium sp.]RWL27939.1 MAG: sugar phosphate isomerase/epimerase [Mesorhizobium sp.]RWL29098.1 MAG: sugar phosphate isomerase/epimerase [Mesorhizobium sp.]RWL37328.1 MAG: sugar phosphate isomerase/epimerase [Mesorhizobium sp.]RWL45199.1 MAG: sugar phosphate isomerase/epimerase [Mesorhizobium sp.]
MRVKLAYHANCWGPLGGNAVGVTSITQLTYRTFGDMERAIREIGEAGFAGTELFDGNLLDYAGRYSDLRAALNQSGVALVAGYCGANFIFDDILAEELARIERAAAAAAELGAEHLVVGGGAKRAGGRQSDDFKRLGAALDKVVDIAGRAGLRAHYHPHLSTIVEGPDEVREVFKHTAIDFCPDTAHLAAAGGDPAAQIREFRERISYVHLKGWQREPFAFTPLDRGDLNMAPIIDALRETEFSGWIATELDAWPDPKQGAEVSMKYLKQATRPN